jgi:hypothetical protein
MLLGFKMALRTGFGMISAQLDVHRERCKRNLPAQETP